jgi:uncharacterized protein
MFQRTLEGRLPKRSFFLFGPRQVGKSTLIRKGSLDLIIDLLDPEEQLAYNKNPNLLKEQMKEAKPDATVFIDEVQRIPKLLDVIHALMEDRPKLKFILCGSSARKLRHGASNLLGGRALYRTMHPLTLEEMSNRFHLPTVLAYGSLPKIYETLLQKKVEEAQDLLRAYVTTYLREEIKAEALVRSLHDFQNFLDIAAAQYAQQVNFSAISRECQVALTTVREYYSILEDTLIGLLLYPHLKSLRKRMSHQPKFYFFDNGVTRAALGALQDRPSLPEQGRLFEQWIVQEITRLNEYGQRDWKLSFWRTSHGAEVDLLVSRGTKILYAIECKWTREPSASHLSGLRSFHEAYPKVPCFLAAPVQKPLRISFVRILPPERLLREL